MSRLVPTTDGIVVLRPPAPVDERLLIAGRDAEFHRWLGPGSDRPEPTACIVVEGEVVGWVDADPSRASLLSGEVNLGYNVFARHRGRGLASRAVQLLLHHLAVRTRHRTATLLIDPANERSLALASRTGFAPVGEVDGQRSFQRPLPPLTYSDGVVTIRMPRPEDLDADLAAKDDEQIDWLWLPGQRERWRAMSELERRAHALRGLQADQDGFGTGPTWTFAVDTRDAEYVASVHCDLANEHVPSGEANVSFAAHPAHRGHGHVSRAVRLVLRFLHDHTGAREAHIVVEAENTASLRVARAVGAAVTERWVNEGGHTMLRHVVPRGQAWSSG
ncbi:hypothetical protein BH18ACT1_BH18ACT1_01620 [soil metagenome]